jgi:hypothetical protein
MDGPRLVDAIDDRESIPERPVLESAPMQHRRAFRQLAANLALVAALFGGLFLGAGNMVMLHLDPSFAAVLHGGHGADEHSGHEHAAHEPEQLPAEALACGDGLPAAAARADAGDGLPVLPAHCLFCLDGITPQPVDPATAADSTPARPSLPAAPATLRATLVARHHPARPRDPPATLA